MVQGRPSPVGRGRVLASVQQIGLGLRQAGMSHQLPSDVDLGERLRASIDGGDLPALDLVDVDRRADRRARRRAVGTAVVAGTGVLALVGVLAVAVPAINGVTGRSTPSASGTLAEQAADPSGDLTDASLWPTLPSLEEHPIPYLTPTAVASAFGAGTWYEPATSMLSPWTDRECAPGPSRDASEAGVGPQPSSVYVEPWAARRSQPAPQPAPGQPLPLPYEAFASLGVLRWDGASEGAGRDWQKTIEQEAAGCPGAVRLDPGAAIGSMPVTVIAQPPTTDPGVIPNGSWSAMAVVAGGPTAVQVRYDGAPDAQAAGDAALALLREGVKAVAAGDRAAAQVDDGARSGGVQAGRLTDFTDPQRWQSWPPLHTIGAPPKVALVTAEDLDRAFPGTGSWQSQPVGGTGTDWLRSWCASGLIVEEYVSGRPGGDPNGYPADEAASIWEGRAGVLQRPQVDVDVLRWHPRDPAGGSADQAGVDDIALSAAETWGAAVAQDAVACPGATTLDPAGLPGAHATLSVVRDGDRWRVQAVSVGGPTAVRIQATVAAESAASAGDQAVALARRVIANTVRADDVEQGRTDPGPLP